MRSLSLSAGSKPNRRWPQTLLRTFLDVVENQDEMLGVVLALCFENVLGIFTGVDFLVLGQEFGWRNSQWSCFGENSCCFFSPSKAGFGPGVHSVLCFSQGFLGHVRSPVTG